MWRRTVVCALVLGLAQAAGAAGSSSSAGAAGSSSSAGAAERITTLTVEDGGGVARTAAPVTTGVPFAKGKIRSIGEIALTREGRRVPAQWRELVRWFDDGSIRWVNLDFVTDLGAGEKRTFDLVKMAPQPARNVGQPLARDIGDRIVVVTGPLKFTVRKKHFNLIDAAWIDESGHGRFDAAHQVIASHERGLLFTSEGRLYRSAADPNPTVTIEENGPIKCQVKATGAHALADGRMTDFMVRLTAYRGIPAVKVQYAWVCKQGTNKDVFTADDIAVELPVVMKPPFTWLLGGDRAPHSGTLPAAQTARIFQESIARYTLGGVAKGEGVGEQKDVHTTGWGAIDDGRLGLAMGRRWFWQTFPADVTLTAAETGGSVRLGLWSKAAGKRVRCYNGAARTHEILVHFFEAPSRDNVASRMLDCNRPLRAFASPAYYCAETRCLGPVAQSDPALFDADDWKAVQRLDGVLDRMIGWVVTKRRGYRGGVESYGYRYFGDFVHWRHGPDPHQIQWDGNYYDYPHANLMQFLRTGDRRFFRMFIECEQSMSDVHVVLHGGPTARDGRISPSQGPKHRREVPPDRRSLGRGNRLAGHQPRTAHSHGRQPLQ